MDAKDDHKLAPGHPSLSQALLQAAALGEPNAVRQVLEVVAPEVARVCGAVLGRGAPDVDDATQESLLALLRALPHYRGECTVVRYANRIAVRTALAQRRRERGKRQREAAAAEPAPCPSRSPDALHEAQRRASGLQRLLQELPPAQAETVALRVLLGCSLRETADATGVPVNTVRSRMRLARESLRTRILADDALREGVERP